MQKNYFSRENATLIVRQDEIEDLIILRFSFLLVIQCQCIMTILLRKVMSFTAFDRQSYGPT